MWFFKNKLSQAMKSGYFTKCKRSLGKWNEPLLAVPKASLSKDGDDVLMGESRRESATFSFSKRKANNQTIRAKEVSN